MLLDFFRIKQSFFFFNDTATTEIYTLSLHDALPISTAPSLTDRILAVDTMTVNIIAIIVLTGLGSGSVLNLDAAILFALTGFVSTVAFCKYLLRGSIIE